MNLTLRQLRYFEALVRHGHFGRAAEACAISQPALSMQIKELEDTLGATLFERRPGRVRLTGFGETVSRRVSAILRSVDELGDLARAAVPGLSGRLRLGVIPTIAPYLLPRILAALGEAFPDLDIRVRETITPRLLDELDDGQLDSAIVALPVPAPRLTEVPLFDEAFVLVRPAAQAGAPVPTPQALCDERLLLLEEGHCFRDQALAFCNLATPAERDGLDGTSLSTLVQMVGAGIGVTLIPEMAVPVETRSAPVSTARFAGSDPQRTVGMVWRDSSPLADQLMQVAEVIRTARQAAQAEPAAPAP